MQQPSLNPEITGPIDARYKKFNRQANLSRLGSVFSAAVTIGALILVYQRTKNWQRISTTALAFGTGILTYGLYNAANHFANKAKLEKTLVSLRMKDKPDAPQSSPAALTYLLKIQGSNKGPKKFLDQSHAVAIGAAEKKGFEKAYCLAWVLFAAGLQLHPENRSTFEEKFQAFKESNPSWVNSLSSAANDQAVNIQYTKMWSNNGEA